MTPITLSSPYFVFALKNSISEGTFRSTSITLLSLNNKRNFPFSHSNAFASNHFASNHFASNHFVSPKKEIKGKKYKKESSSPFRLGRGPRPRREGPGPFFPPCFRRPLAEPPARGHPPAATRPRPPARGQSALHSSFRCLSAEPLVHGEIGRTEVHGEIVK